MFIYYITGHSDGKFTPHIIILTDYSLYITTKTRRGKLVEDAYIPHSEVDYISVSLRSKRKILVLNATGSYI